MPDAPPVTKAVAVFQVPMSLRAPSEVGGGARGCRRPGDRSTPPAPGVKGRLN
jgi:hypothetical protein